jgi:hypothetical protein
LDAAPPTGVTCTDYSIVNVITKIGIGLDASSGKLNYFEVIDNIGDHFGPNPELVNQPLIVLSGPLVGAEFFVVAASKADASRNLGGSDGIKFLTKTCVSGLCQANYLWMNPYHYSRLFVDLAFNRQVRIQLPQVSDIAQGVFGIQCQQKHKIEVTQASLNLLPKTITTTLD